VPFRLNDAADGFAVIEREAFPKQIATQNMWLSAATRYSGVSTAQGFQMVDTWEQLRKLEIEGPRFSHTLTAQMCAD
jgi:hypothetical protein